MNHERFECPFAAAASALEVPTAPEESKEIRVIYKLCAGDNVHRARHKPGKAAATT